MSKNTGTSELINYFDLGANGDVGIAGSLDVNTIANATTDTDKFLVSDTGIIKYRTGTQLLSDIGAQGALTNPVTGTGSNGTIPVFTGSTTLGNSIIQSNATQVNIVGNGSQLLFDSLGQSKSGGIQYTNDFELLINNSRGTGSAIFLGNTNIDFNTNVSGNPRIRITDLGNVGINTTTPATTLEVNGVGLFSGISLVGNTKNGVYILDTVIASLAGSGARPLQIQSQTLSIYTGNTYSEKLKVFENGNVVISTSPADAGFKLDVNGTVRFSGALTLTASANRINSGNELRFYRVDNAIYTQLYDGGNANGFVLDNRNGDGFSFQSAGTNQLRISSTGASTFSSKVGVGGAAPTYSITAYNASNGTTAAFGGTARGIRIDNDGTFSSGRSTIYGVDSSFYGSYQPLSIEASSLALQAVTGGNVGIGTASPDANSRLDVNGQAFVARLAVYNNNGTPSLGTSPMLYSPASGTLAFSTATAERMRITSGGQLLIGTTSTDSGISVDFQNLSSASSNVLVRAKNTTLNEDCGFVISANSSGTQRDYIIGIQTIVNSPDLTFSGPTGFQWYVGGTERMRITSGGAVCVNRNDAPYGNFVIKSNSTTSYAGLNVYANGSERFIALNHTGSEGIIETEFGVGGGHTPLTFRTGGSERMRITSGGDVCIGITSALQPATNRGSLSINGASSSILSFGVGSATKAYLYTGGTTLTIESTGASGDMVFATGSADRLKITSSGNVLIGTTTDGGYKLDVAGKARVNNSDGFFLQSGSQFRQMYFDGFSTLYFWNGSNQANLSSAGAWVNASDITIKKEITEIKYTLSDLLKLKPKSYKMVNNDLNQIGFIAQDVEKIISELVTTDDKGMKSLNYGNMNALIVKAIQEQQKQIEELKNKLS